MKKIIWVVVAGVALAGLVVYYGFPAQVLAAAMQLERGQAGLTEHTIRAAEHDIRYLEAKGGNGTILLVHGFGADKDNWTRIAKHLSGYHLIALDLPGFGDSERKPEASYDIVSQVARLRAFADALGLERFHLAGNSMGGHIAAAYAATFTDQVLSLGLFNAGGITSPRPSELARLVANGSNPLLINTAADYDNMLAFVFVEPPFLPGPVKAYFAGRAVENVSFTAKVWADLKAKPYPLEPVLNRIKARTLILWGDTDRLLDVSSVNVFADGISTATDITVLKNCGHAPMIERPAETAQAYLAFLADSKTER